MKLPKVRLDALTSAEARERFSNRPVILLPMGSLEDQGPQAPMGDFRLAEAIAVRIAEEALSDGQDALVAPVIPFGGADYFATVPGAIALSHATLLAVISETLARLLAHGLDRILIVNGHGGNIPAIEEATRAAKHRDGTVVPVIHIWRILGAEWPRLFGAGAEGRLGHGADPVWSVAQALLPGLCRPDLIPARAERPSVNGLEVTGFGTARFGAIEVGVPIEYDQIAPTGIAGGDPDPGSAEDGSQAVEFLVEQGAALVAHLRAQG